MEKALYDLKNLQGPVYNIERNHNFAEIDKQIVDLKSLSYPVFNIEHEHKFQDLVKDVATLKEMSYPVRGVDYNHNFNVYSNNNSLSKCILKIIPLLMSAAVHTFKTNATLMLMYRMFKSDSKILS